MRNYFPKRLSGALLHTLSKLYDVPVGFVTPLFWCGHWCIALFAVAEGLLLLDIGWFVLFLEIKKLRYCCNTTYITIRLQNWYMCHQTNVIESSLSMYGSSDLIAWTPAFMSIMNAFIRRQSGLDSLYNQSLPKLALSVDQMVHRLISVINGY